jgi:hypothetical protein
MARLLAALPLFLVASLAYADVAPAEPGAGDGVGMIGTLVFVVLFVGACAGFAYLVWKGEKNKPKE